jgi:hypothetical protein
MAKTSIKEPSPRTQTGHLWTMTRARTRFKTARAELGRVYIEDDIGDISLELLHILDGVGALLDKRIAKAKEQGK